MKTDNIENQLQRQPFRAIPPEWRRDILQATRLAVAPQEAPATGSQVWVWLHGLLWPCPRAWIGLAAAWAFILAAQLAGIEKPEVSMAAAAPVPAEVRMALREQKLIREELISSSDFSSAEAVSPTAPRPQSNRRSLSACV